jgi:hypothetical protein
MPLLALSSAALLVIITLLFAFCEVIKQLLAFILEFDALAPAVSRFRRPVGGGGVGWGVAGFRVS